jgi:hypothetical protein
MLSFYSHCLSVCLSVFLYVRHRNLDLRRHVGLLDFCRLRVCIHESTDFYVCVNKMTSRIYRARLWLRVCMYACMCVTKCSCMYACMCVPKVWLLKFTCETNEQANMACKIESLQCLLHTEKERVVDAEVGQFYVYVCVCVYVCMCVETMEWWKQR